MKRWISLLLGLPFVMLGMVAAFVVQYLAAGWILYRDFSE